MSTNTVDLSEVRRAWSSRYGASTARRMLSGAYGMAYDARQGLAYGSRRGRDQDPDDQASGMGQVKVFLMNRLSPEDFQRLEAMLQALSNGGEEEGNPDHTVDPAASKPQGRDDPPLAPPGGAM